MKKFNGMWLVRLKGLNISERISRRKWLKNLKLMREYANRKARHEQ